MATKPPTSNDKFQVRWVSDWMNKDSHIQLVAQPTRREDLIQHRAVRIQRTKSCMSDQLLKRQTKMLVHNLNTHIHTTYS